MKQLFIIVTSIGAILASCKSSQKASGALVPVIDTIIDDEFRKVIRDKQLFASVTEVVPLDTVYISKDTLHVLTKKIMGCETENFKLMWNGMKTKSLPPQTGIKLFQQVDATCNERHVFHLIFNITSLKTKSNSDTIQTDAATNSHLVVKLGGWKNPLMY